MADPMGPGPVQWVDDLSPIAPADWSYDRAAHLLERAAFGAMPEDVERVARMSPSAAVTSLIAYQSTNNPHLKALRAFGRISGRVH